MAFLDWASLLLLKMVIGAAICVQVWRIAVWMRKDTPDAP